MKKKLFPILVGLLTVTALTACSTNKVKESDSSSSSMTAESSKVEQSTSTGSSSEVKKLKESTVSYPSDQEIEAMRTLGDAKAVFKSLLDSNLADYDALLNQLPEEARKELESDRERFAQRLNQQKEKLEKKYEAYGDDNTPMSENGRKNIIEGMKDMRDQFKERIATLKEEFESLLQ